MLRGLAGAVSAPLRRSLSTAASRPPWAMVYSRAALDASAAPSPGARASLDLDAAPYVSHISVPAHLADGMDFAAASVRATSSDGLLLLDLAEARHLFPPGPPGARESLDRNIQVELAAVGASFQLDVARFVCNPLSGHIFRLPVPAMGAARTSTVFGLLTQSSDGSHGPPDRYAVAQLSCRAADNGIVLRRFLSETGEWDERELLVPSMWPGWQHMQVDTNHTVLAFGDRLWWVDVTWGAFSVDPFSDRPEVRFVELPQGVLSDFDTTENLMLGKRRLMGVSEGKLRYIEVSTEKEFVVSSFSLDGEGCYWKPTRETTVKLVLPNQRKPLEKDMPWIAAVDPFNADILYYQSGHDIIAMDMANGEVMGKRAFPDSITGLSPCNTAFFLPCVLPTWLESSHVPGAAALPRKTPNCTRNTLAETLVRVDKDQKK
ncbi:uncharacterized protein [Lolium perenne]|uniref:uncharacterized protein n=1 Tax=Lolium perenne TaxID=4522 RepID=UPI0021F615D2|nr:uncharacterized protein LOC127320637 [Lolium perenne]